MSMRQPSDSSISNSGNLSRLPLQIEMLEDRTVPTWTVNLTDGVLTLTSDDNGFTQLNIFIDPNVSPDVLVFSENAQTISSDDSFDFTTNDGSNQPTLKFAGITKLVFFGAPTQTNDIVMDDFSNTEIKSIIMTGGSNDDVLGSFLGLFNNKITYLIDGGGGDDQLFGDDAADTLIGGAGADLVEGYEGDDTYVFDLAVVDNESFGTDLAGNDTIKLVGNLDATLNLSKAGVQQVSTNLKLDLGKVQFENIIGGDGNDMLTGNALNNNITGGLGNDTIATGDGDDTISYAVGDGLDELDSGLGSDTFDLSGVANDVILDFVASTATIDTKVVKLANFENFTVGAQTKTLTVNYTAIADDATITDDGVALNKFSLLTEAVGFSKIKFFHPTDLLQINLGDEADTLAVTGLDTALLPAKVKFFGEAGDDTVSFTLDDYTVISGSRFTFDGGTDPDKFIVNGKANSVTFDRTATPPNVVIDGTIIETPAVTDLNTNIDTPTLNLILAVNQDYKLTDGVAANDGISQFFNNVTMSFVNFVSPTSKLNLFGSDGSDDLLTIQGLDSKLAAPFTYDGKAGSDTLVVATGKTTDVMVDLATATAKVDGKTYSFLNTEQLTSDVEAASLTVTATANDDTVQFSDDLDTSNKFSFATDTATNFKLKFFHPTTLLKVDLAAGNDLLTVNSLDTALIPTTIQLLGSAGNDTLEGTAAADSIDGGAGDDILLAGGDNDQLIGGDGNDGLDGEDGNDTLDGGIGNDLLFGGLGADSILGGDGNDSAGGGAGNDTINGSAGNDLLFGESENDLILGGDGADSIGGSAGNDSIDGGLGADSLFGEAGNDIIIGGDGNDSIGGGDGNDVLNGGVGDDVIFGESGLDSIVAGSGNDILGGGDGDDTINGEAGDDSLEGEAGNDSLLGGAGRDTVHGGSGTNTVGSGDLVEPGNYFIG